MAIYYPPTQNGLQKTLAAQLNQGVTTQMTLNNTTGLQNKPGVCVVDRIDTAGNEKDTVYREYISYTGISGNNLTGLTRGLGGSIDQDHLVGAVVEFIPDVTVFQGLIDTFTTEHNTDGTHGAITATSLSTDSISEKTANAGITFNQKIKTDTIEEKTSGSGVSFNHKIILPNNTPIQQKDSSGTERDVFKIDNSNNLVIGDSNLNGIIFNKRFGCIVHPNSSLAVPNTTVVKITNFNSIEYNPSNEWDSANSRFIASSNGLYYFNLIIAYDSSTFETYIYVKKNTEGNWRLRNHIYVNITYQTISTSLLLYLNKNDYVTFYTWHNKGSTINIINNIEYCSLYVCKVI